LQDHDLSQWKPADWVELLLPVTEFLNIVIPRFTTDQEDRIAARMQLIRTLLEAAARFQQTAAATPRSLPRLTSSLQKLTRC